MNIIKIIFTIMHYIFWILLWFMRPIFFVVIYLWLQDKSYKLTRDWSDWFAWYPIAIDDKVYFLKIIEWRVQSFGSTSETYDDWIEYREKVS